jgi:hypothetical protein
MDNNKKESKTGGYISLALLALISIGLVVCLQYKVKVPIEVIFGIFWIFMKRL